MFFLPGPASSVVERSLRKVCSPGDRGSNLAEDFTFQSRIKFIRNKGLTTISNYRTCYIVSRNLLKETAVATISTSEEERSLENWSSDVKS